MCDPCTIQLVCSFQDLTHGVHLCVYMYVQKCVHVCYQDGKGSMAEPVSTNPSLPLGESSDSLSPALQPADKA